MKGTSNLELIKQIAAGKLWAWLHFTGHNTKYASQEQLTNFSFE